MILAVLCGEGALRSRRYRQGRTLWLIQTKVEKTQTKEEASFTKPKGEVNRTPHTTKARAYWISQETWQLADGQASLQGIEGDRTGGQSGTVGVPEIIARRWTAAG